MKLQVQDASLPSLPTWASASSSFAVVSLKSCLGGPPATIRKETGEASIRRRFRASVIFLSRVTVALKGC